MRDVRGQPASLKAETRKNRTHAYLSCDGNEASLTPSKTLIGIERRACTHFADTDLGDPVLVQL